MPHLAPKGGYTPEKMRQGMHTPLHSLCEKVISQRCESLKAVVCAYPHLALPICYLLCQLLASQTNSLAFVLARGCRGGWVAGQLFCLWFGGFLSLCASHCSPYLQMLSAESQTPVLCEFSSCCLGGKPLLVPLERPGLEYKYFVTWESLLE